VAKFNQDVPQFGSAKPANAGGSHDCAECELMLADALDGTLSTEDQAKFDGHLLGCNSCSQMLADAQRGAAWLEMLRMPRPEPSAALLDRILAQTGGQTGTSTGMATGQIALLSPASDGVQAAGIEGLVSARRSNVLPFRTRVATAFQGKGLGQSMLQPRLAMTAAMAFFSIGLTLNLTGVHLNELRTSDLKPANLRRSFYQANAHVVRYYDNLRVVYELESRVRDLQRTNDSDSSTAPAPKPANETPKAKPDKPDKPDKMSLPTESQPEQKQTPRPNAGTSRRQPLVNSLSLLASYRADAPDSPLRLSAFNSLTHTSLTSNLQEGELV
jgi:hypothetical protein